MLRSLTLSAELFPPTTSTIVVPKGLATLARNISAASELRVGRTSDQIEGRDGALRSFLSLFLAILLLQAASLAQTAEVRTSAAKPIQQSQAAASDSSPTTDAAVKVELADRPPTTREVKLPAGTPVDIEAVYTVSSVDLRPGDLLSFRVLIPVTVDGFTVIERGSLVTARVAEAKRGGHWGRAGRLSWMMQDVVAVDLTRVSLQTQKSLPAGRNGVKGTSHGGEVATKTIVFGALLAPAFPIAPLALMAGFKRGEDAILPAGKRFVVFVQTDTNLKIPREH